MFRKWWLALPAMAMAAAAHGQERRTRLDVEHYNLEAEINPRTQTVAAKASVRFLPLDDNTSSAAFELHNSLNVARVTDDKGNPISASRNQQDFTIRVSFPQPLPKGQPATLTFEYEGRLSGNEESPVYGVKFASIKEDFSYLLYPARWFPVSGYTSDRYTAEMKITVPAGYQVVGETTMKNPSFPGSIAVVREEPARVPAEGLNLTVYFRGAEKPMANVYAQETAKMVNFFSGTFGLAPYANLALVETEAGAPNGYAAPGVLFLAPRAIGQQVNTRLLANQVARQWWHVQVSPSSRNHIWLTNGLAAYSELLYIGHVSGPGAVETSFKDLAVEALTIDNVPVIQAARLDDYSPEYWALTASKGSAVLHMLRFVIGDEAFEQTLKEFATRYAWKQASTDDFRKVAEAASKQDLGYFFIQWIESSGAPEFKLEYTVFRTAKGFRVMGKVAQDLDTFRMPVELRIETEGNPEDKRIEVVGTSSEFVVDTFGKPKSVSIDPAQRLLRYEPKMRVAVSIRRGEQFAEISEFGEALKEYQKALEVNRNSSLAHYRIAEVFFLQNNYQSAANEFREALNGDLEPKWTEVWAHINLGKIFDITGQRDRAVNEYTLAIRTKDNTQGAQEEAAKHLKTPYERQRRPDAD
jgi:aminopeptidase N